MASWGRLLFVALVLVAVATAAGGSYWLNQSLWGTQSTRPVDLEIADGSSARGILRQLEDVGLLPSVFAGRIYLRAWGRGRALHYGHFVFPGQSRPADILEKILDGRIEMFSITIVEGSDTETVTS